MRGLLGHLWAHLVKLTLDIRVAWLAGVHPELGPAGAHTVRNGALRHHWRRNCRAAGGELTWGCGAGLPEPSCKHCWEVEPLPITGDDFVEQLRCAHPKMVPGWYITPPPVIVVMGSLSISQWQNGLAAADGPISRTPSRMVLAWQACCQAPLLCSVAACAIAWHCASTAIVHVCSRTDFDSCQHRQLRPQRQTCSLLG